MKNINLVFTKSMTFNLFFREITKELSKDFKIKIWCTDTEYIDGSFNKQKILLPTNWVKLLNPFKFIKYVTIIRKFIKKSNNETFVLNTPLAAHFFRIASIFIPITIIYFVHGFRFNSKEKKLVYFFHFIIEYLLSFMTDKYIVINNEDAYIVKKKFKKKFLKINGVGVNSKINNNITNRKADENINIGVLSAYRKNKGYEDIIKISSLLKNINFNCYGYDNFEKYQKKINKLSLNNIKLNKFDPSLKFKQKKYNLLLHLSKREGLCVSIIESLKQGIPIIAYDIRGVNDIVKNGYNGYLFEFNQIDQIADKIIQLNDDINLYNQLQINCLNTIDDTFSHKYLSIKIKNFLL